MDINYKQNGVRFALPAHDTLVSWINQKNQRSFEPSDFIFDAPVAMAPDGWVRVTGRYMPLDQPVAFQLQRVDLSLIPELQSLTIHVTSPTKERILDAIHSQYGLYLDLDLVDLDLERIQLSNYLGDVLNGFDGPDLDVVPPPGLNDMEGTIVISDLHPVWTGTLNFKIRSSMVMGDISIDTKLDLRDYYRSINDSRPWVETLQPGGVWLVTRDIWHDHTDKRLVDANLYNLDRNERLVDYDLVASILTELTGHPWVVDTVPSEYNVMGIEILYNGTSGKYPNVAPVGYSYLIILKLNDLCNNLKGNIHIGYQYANNLHPVYSTKTPAGIPPLG